MGVGKSVEVYVTLDEFEDDEILEAAVDIVQSALKRPHPYRDENIAALRLLLTGDEMGEDECRSTASTLRTYSDLSTWIEKQSLFHFATTTAKPAGEGKT